jgi:hypothetical protein
MASLLNLPIELLLEIQDYLPTDAILSLKLSHPALNNALPALPRPRHRIRTLTKCARYAIERHLLLPGRSPSQLRCILCKKIYPDYMFNSSSSPACGPIGFAYDVYGASRLEVVELPPSFCSWHVSRLVKMIETGPGGRNEWVSDIKKMCMHDGCIEGWQKCTCVCDTGSCGYRMIRTYTRYVIKRPSRGYQYQFWRNSAAGESEDSSEKAKGRLFVRESWRNGEWSLRRGLD